MYAGFWYPYRNIFSIVDELGLKPFTNWTRSAQYSPEGLEVCPKDSEVVPGYSEKLATVPKLLKISAYFC